MIGAAAGQDAVDHYAQVATDPNSSTAEKVGATVGGVVASLWTRDTYAATATTLMTGAAVAGPAARIGQALDAAATSAGNSTVVMGSQTEAQIAGRIWSASSNSRPLLNRATSEVVGQISGDGTRLYRAAQMKATGPNAGQMAANLVRKVGEEVVANVHLVIP